VFGDVLDYWSLFHAFFGFIMAHAGRQLATTVAWAWAWEWFEETDLEPLAGSPAFGVLVNVSPLNAIADVAIAVLAFLLTRRIERFVRAPSPNS
jgi:hypothetical protein